MEKRRNRFKTGQPIHWVRPHPISIRGKTESNAEKRLKKQSSRKKVPGREGGGREEGPRDNLEWHPWHLSCRPPTTRHRSNLSRKDPRPSNLSRLDRPRQVYSGANHDDFNGRGSAHDKLLWWREPFWSCCCKVLLFLSSLPLSVNLTLSPSYSYPFFPTLCSLLQFLQVMGQFLQMKNLESWFIWHFGWVRNHKCYCMLSGYIHTSIESTVSLCFIYFTKGILSVRP